MENEVRKTKTPEQKIEENKLILQSLLKKKENLEINISQIENRIRNLELSLKQKNVN